MRPPIIHVDHVALYRLTNALVSATKTVPAFPTIPPAVSVPVNITDVAPAFMYVLHFSMKVASDPEISVADK